MPQGDGVTLLDNIQKLKDKSPDVVLITAYSEVTREVAISKGALELMSKPIDLEYLEKLLEYNLLKAD